MEENEKKRPWLIPAIIAAVVVVYFIGFFSGKTLSSKPDFSRSAASSAPTAESGNKLDLQNIPAGMYKVGPDIPSGEYKVYYDTSTDMSYCLVNVYKDSSGASTGTIVGQQMIASQGYITVQDGQYLEIRDGYAKKVN